MSNPISDRGALEDRWRNRVNEARARLQFARNFVKEVQGDLKSGVVAGSDASLAFQRALRAETFALAEYHRVLRLFTALVVEGKIPDESEWLKARRGAGDPESHT